MGSESHRFIKVEKPEHFGCKFPGFNGYYIRELTKLGFKISRG